MPSLPLLSWSKLDGPSACVEGAEERDVQRAGKQAASAHCPAKYKAVVCLN